MASIDWSQCPAVESISGKVRRYQLTIAAPVLPVAAIFENLKTFVHGRGAGKFPCYARADSDRA